MSELFVIFICATGAFLMLIPRFFGEFSYREFAGESCMRHITAPLQSPFHAIANKHICHSKLSGISYTPAILIDGKLLSPLYSYSDLYGIARTLNSE